jgi:selenide,water dikinase
VLRDSAFSSLLSASSHASAAADPSALLVGLDTPDDAAVVRMPGAPDDAPALVLTTDFFTPLVDDPVLFGRIAAINAMSDVFAMGGTPRFALNLAGFPTRTLPLTILAQILAGGAMACRDEGVLVLGGHTIDDPEPKFGLAVIGTVDPAHVWRKRGARPGDALVITKGLGTGIAATAFKRDAIDDVHPAMQSAIASMTTSNRRAAELARPLAVHAATDVTGYGLLGHLLEMLGGLDVDAELVGSAIPVLRDARTLAQAGHVPGGTTANLAFAEERCDFAETIDDTTRTLLADAQTSGGLLIALPVDDARRLVSELGPPAAIIGDVRAGRGRIRVV